MDDSQRNSVKQMLNYIESHLSSQISLYQLAQTGGYSIGMLPGCSRKLLGQVRFLMSAAGVWHQLGVGKQNIIDVAMEFVFDFHEGFTRAFTKQFGNRLLIVDFQNYDVHQRVGQNQKSQAKRNTGFTKAKHALL